MKKYIKITLIAIIFLAIASMISASLTGFTINKYDYTTAICDENNFCQDHLISCENDKLTNIVPITGAFVQNSEEWIDPRERKENYCS